LVGTGIAHRLTAWNRGNMRRRARSLPDVTSSDRLDQRFMDVLRGDASDITISIYRTTEDGYVIRPMLAKWGVLRDLDVHIRAAFGPGGYAGYSIGKGRVQ